MLRHSAKDIFVGRLTDQADFPARFVARTLGYPLENTARYPCVVFSHGSESRNGFVFEKFPNNELRTPRDRIARRCIETVYRSRALRPTSVQRVSMTTSVSRIQRRRLFVLRVAVGHNRVCDAGRARADVAAADGDVVGLRRAPGPVRPAGHAVRLLDWRSRCGGRGRRVPFRRGRARRVADHLPRGTCHQHVPAGRSGRRETGPSREAPELGPRSSDLAGRLAVTSVRYVIDDGGSIFVSVVLSIPHRWPASRCFRAALVADPSDTFPFRLPVPRNLRRGIFVRNACRDHAIDV